MPRKQENKPFILISVHGGVIQDIATSFDGLVDVFVHDNDNIEAGSLCHCPNCNEKPEPFPVSNI